MFTFIGVVLLIALLVLPFLRSFLKNKHTPALVSTLMDNKKVYGLALMGSIVLILSSGLFFIARPGTAYAVQYWWGGDNAVTSQGVAFKGFSPTIPFSFEIACQDFLDEHGQQDEIYYRPAIEREFADAIKAKIASSLIVSVDYHDKEAFLSMADKNRSEEKLVHARIVPVYDQVVKNTCKLLTAQEYISGASAQFDFYLRDQLQHGMYITEEVYEVTEDETIGTDSVARTVKSKESTLKKQKRYVISKDKKGNPLRDVTNSLTRYGLTVQQAAVTRIDWEPSFDTRLDEQKKQVAATQLKKQEAETEYYSTQTAIQKGERLKAERQKQLEVTQIESTMAAETSAKTAEWKAVEENNLLKAAKTAAERMKTESDAKFYQNSKMVAAGLTPQERAEWDYKKAVGVAEQLKSWQPPNTVIIGNGSTGSDGLLSTMLGAQLAGQMLKDKQ